MHSRKKLQKKETSAPIPKKHLEYEVSQRAYVLRLGDERCFYVNHSGVVKESLAKIRKGLSQKKKREMSQNWFESWFNSSPWFTTLISSLVGPLITLLLLLTLRPC